MTDISRLLESAFAKHQAGQVSEARGLYERVLELGDNAEAFHWLGILELQSGAATTAVSWLQKAAQIEPANAQILANLGNACFVAAEIDEAVVAYKKSLALNPASAETHASLGNLYLATGRTNDAIVSYKQALQLNPTLAEVWRGLATAQLARGEHARAIAAIDRAGQEHERSGQPVSLPIAMTRGNVLVGAGFAEQAVSCYQTIVDNAPNFAQAHASLGGAQRTLGRLDLAAKHCQRAIELEPKAPAGHYALGLVHMDRGDLEKARQSFERTLEYDQGHGRAHRLIASLTTHTDEHPHIQRMRDALAGDSVSGDERAHLHFGLGKALEDAARYDEAFEHIHKGNSLHRQRTSYSLDYDERLMERTTEVFTSEWLERTRVTEAMTDAPRPIFVVGMPRSGTSLIEQILASHPDVHGAGELNLLERCIGDALGDSSLDSTVGSAVETLEQCGSGEMKNIGDDYLSRITKLAPDSRYVVDKMPANFLHLGVIHSALPSAHIIHAQRHPMATCWSIYKNYFGAQGHAYSFDLTELGNYHRFYLKLMRHWQNVLGDVIHTVDYEALVSDQEANSRQLLAHCGLEWDTACLDFHKNRRPVQTLSASQVRQPIYSTALAQWEHYVVQLKPLAFALERS